MKNPDRFIFVALLPFFLAGACSRAPARPRRQAWPTMGTVAAVQCPDPSVDLDSLHQTAESIYGLVTEEFSAWSATNMLARVNAAAGSGSPVPVTPAFAGLLARALSVSRLSDGAFNPLIGPVMSLWGFNRSGATPSVPSAGTLAAAVARSDWRLARVTSDPPSVLLPAAGMKLDFGGIAKGYAVDRVWEAFREHGVTNALIDLGGNLRCLGEAAPGRGGWRTGIRNPFGGAEPITTFLLKPGQAVATSGNYERFVEIGGIRYAHIMDARTGRPVTGMAATTVIAPTAELADVLSTTLFVLGPEKGQVYLKKNAPQCEALWIPDIPDKLTLIASPGFPQKEPCAANRP
jgi:thiamine biosynthesis lipoprotein